MDCLKFWPKKEYGMVDNFECKFQVISQKLFHLISENLKTDKKFRFFKLNAILNVPNKNVINLDRLKRR